MSRGAGGVHAAPVAAVRACGPLHRDDPGAAAGTAADRPCVGPRCPADPGPDRTWRVVGAGPDRARRPGRERRLKQHGATRRCEVCKAVDGYRAGELTAEAALARAGWARSNEVQRSILLEIFGLPEPREATATQPPEAAPAQPPDASRQEPQPAPGPDPEIDAVVDALIKSWRSPKAEAQPQASAPEPEAAEPELEAAEPELEAAL